MLILLVNLLKALLKMFISLLKQKNRNVFIFTSYLTDKEVDKRYVGFSAYRVDHTIFGK